MSDPRKAKRWLLAIGFVGVVVAVLLGRPLFRWLMGPPSPEELAKPHLDRCPEGV